MVSTKATFTLDEETIFRIGDAAERVSMPKSQVVREAVKEYHSRLGRLSESERQRLLKVFDDLVPAIPSRPQHDAEEELQEIRRARRSGGRRSMAGTGK
jgi:hypothetical protein